LLNRARSRLIARQTSSGIPGQGVEVWVKEKGKFFLNGVDSVTDRRGFFKIEQ
jgi:hypothetical protein